jgi:hypothetical protein
LVIIEFELRTLSLLIVPHIAPFEPHLQPLFALVIFQIGSCCLHGLASDHNPPTCFLCNWDFRYMSPCLTLLFEMEVSPFSQAGLEPSPPTNSWDYRHDPL